MPAEEPLADEDGLKGARIRTLTPTRARILAHVDPEARGRIEALGRRADRTENLLLVYELIAFDADRAGSFRRVWLALLDAHEPVTSLRAAQAPSFRAG